MRRLKSQRRTFFVKYVTKLTKSSDAPTVVSVVIERATSLKLAGQSFLRRHPSILVRGRIPPVLPKWLLRREIEGLHQLDPIEAASINTPEMNPNLPREGGEEPEEDPRGLELFFQRLAPWRGMVWKLKNHPLYGEILKLKLNNHRSGSSGE